MLNAQQRSAVLASGKRVLVLAGAGSGKTKMIMQKIIYLIQEKGIDPSAIMAVTFTKNAALEMVDRLILANDTDGFYQSVLSNKALNFSTKDRLRKEKIKEYKWINKLTIRTFHSLAYSILRTYGSKEFDNKFKLLMDEKKNEHSELKSISADETQFEVVHKILINCCGQKDYILKFKRFIIDYFIDKIHIDNFESIADYNDGKYYTTLRGEKVRSKSEQYIADWLFRHNIKYQYEPKVQFSEFAFRPDFHLTQLDIFLEHVSELSSSDAKKKEQFESAGRLCCRTYEHMTRDTNHINLALDRIVKNRLPSLYEEEVALSYEEEMRGKQNEVADFLRQVLRILDLIQVENISLDKIKNIIEKEPHERVRLFFAVSLPIIEGYKNYCLDKSYLDFNTLLDTCIDLVNNQEDIRTLLHEKYKYVMVDEFQDVNKVQVKFLKTIMNKDAQLFCVGDDWQSIYGFRGSDLSFIVEFSRYFADAKIYKLTVNYRSTDYIVKASNEVISHNKYKVDKVIKSKKKSKAKIEVYSGTDLKDNISFVRDTVVELCQLGMPESDILVLYRRSKMYEPYRAEFKKMGLNIQGRTIHAAKGLEAKIVFVIGLTDGPGGFPDIWMADRIYQVLRPTSIDNLLEEERRLFYVAITRAQNSLYLITEIGNESRFIDEIPEEFKAVYTTPIHAKSSIVTCEKCKHVIDKSYKFCPHCGFGLEK
jgi:DNA helicase IV